MKYATRINSFLRFDKDLMHAFQAIGKIEGVDFVDLNYPEHFEQYNVDEVKKGLQENALQCNAINLRFRSKFIHGEFGNPDEKIVEEAIQLSKEACEVCNQLGGRQVIVWLGFDGYDYSFQIDYVEYWKKLVKAFQDICDSTNLPVSIEYKPYEERVHAYIDSFGTTLSLVRDINRENLGVTLDFCHMIMKKENPAMAAQYLLDKGKLFNIHLNDGEGSTDDGLMVGTVHFWKTLEIMFYLLKYQFDGVIYFDTFPKREKAVEETQANSRMVHLIEKKINAFGLDRMEKVIRENDGIQVCNMMMDFLET